MFCSDASYLMDKFRYVKDIHARLGKNTSSITKDGSSMYSMSVSGTMSRTEGTMEALAKKGEHKQTMMEVLKIFMTDIDLGVVEGLKIAYKVSLVVTAEF